LEQIDDPLPGFLFLLDSIFQAPSDFSVYFSMAIVLLLLMLSALISGSETAFFSLSSSQIEDLESTNDAKSKRILQLLSKPKQLLATILIANNFVNVAIIILSAYITSILFNFSEYPILGYIFEVVIVTFILLLLGEITPKVYANQYNHQFAKQVATPLNFIHNLIKPLSRVLAFSTAIVDKRITKKGHDISKSELDEAIELTSGDISNEEEKNMLKGIVKFSDMETSEIMKARVDISAIDMEESFQKILERVVTSGFSRIPVYKGSLDDIKGVLYIKDLLPYMNEKSNYEWQLLIRPCFFVPENKKINELLQEFRNKKIHLAIVVDEYGGTSGLVTLEDILEEIVGEINDEFDEIESDIDFEKIDDYTYIFEAKTPLHDFCKVLKINNGLFDDVEGDFDTLAGFVLEKHANIPKKGVVVRHSVYRFEIFSLDYKRIKKIKIHIDKENSTS
jgi:gliding motility-associated protein GldE